MIKKILGICCATIASALCVYILVHALWRSSVDEGAVALAQELDAHGDASFSEPVGIRIPSLSIDATVVPVGVTRKGNMATPERFADVGWYRYGAVPGQLGSAVLAGHLNNGLAFPAVFAHLADAQVGESIYVDTIDGRTLEFVIESSAMYDLADSADEVFTTDDQRYLRLITCAGAWVPELRTHRERLVVTAVLQDIEV